MELRIAKAQVDAHISDAIDWESVQLAQLSHDEAYHREIARLTVKERLTHMTLHFAKYAGRLLEGATEAVFHKTAVDTLVIAVSCSNILNVGLSKAAPSPTGEMMSRHEFAVVLAVAAGRMATACEKLDHLEDFPFRKTLTDETRKILQACIDLFASEGWNVANEINDRLPQIKAKAFFHGKI